jgi:hypothetical protein
MELILPNAWQDCHQKRGVMDTVTRWMVVILWHSVPVWAYTFGSRYAVAAALLLVMLPYIKCRKLTQQADNLLLSRDTGDGVQAEVQSIHAARRRWQYLTWPRA